MSTSSAVERARDADISVSSRRRLPDEPLPGARAQNIPQASSSGVHLTRDADYLIQAFLPPDAYAPPFETFPKLPLPYCAPQIATGFDAPFSRGYSRTLESVDIPQEQLLAFIDGLNLAMTASPPLRVVNLAGMVIGFVPYHWAMVAGAAIQVGAQAGMRVLSKSLTDRYLRAANLRLFKPRGLSVRICTAAAMQHLVLHTPIEPPPSKLKRIGRGAGSLLMRVPIPIASVLVHAVADKPPKVSAMDPASRAGTSKKLLATKRRVAALEGYALPLEFENMPKPEKAQGVMDTMSSWGVKFDSWREGRKQTLAEERRVQLERIEQEEVRPVLPSGQQRGGISSGVRGLLGGGRPGIGGGGLIGGLLNAAMEARGRSTETRRGVDEPTSVRSEGGGLRGLVGHTTIGRVLNGGTGGILGRGRGNDKSTLELQVADADLQEYWESAKILWVVIMSSEMDNEIEGIELAESYEDVERVDEETWQAEMQVERQELEFDGEVERIAEQNERSQH